MKDLKSIVILVFVFGLILSSCQTESKQETKQETVSAEKTTEVETPVIEEVEEEKEKSINTLGPMDSIKDLDQKIEAYHLGSELSEEQKQQNKKLKSQIVRGTFDIEELCRLALAKHWDTISKDPRNKIVNLMTELLEKKAIFSQEHLSGRDKYYKIDYLSESISKNDPNQAEVKTRMTVPKKGLKINIKYKMLKTKWGWKIFDIILDDSSLMLNYRSAFHNVITKHGVEELISRLQSKVDGAGSVDKTSDAT